MRHRVEGTERFGGHNAPDGPNGIATRLMNRAHLEHRVVLASNAKLMPWPITIIKFQLRTLLVQEVSIISKLNMY